MTDLSALCFQHEMIGTNTH